MRFIHELRAPLVLMALLLVSAGAQAAPAKEPGVADWLSPPIEAAGPDRCGCARELTACLFAATLDLNRCLFNARGPVQEAICFIRYEVRVALCFQESVSCFARCLA